MPIYKATPDYAVYCDTCTEFIDFGEITFQPKTTKAIIRKSLKKEGWRFVGDECYCPECNDTENLDRY